MNGMTVAAYGVGALAAWLVYSSIRGFFHRQKLKGMGNKQRATVQSVRGGGSFTNGQPDLMVTLEYTAADGQTYQRSITRTFSMGQLPRRGDAMEIWVNPADPSDFDLASKDPIPPGYVG